MSLITFPQELGKYAKEGHAHMRFSINELIGNTREEVHVIHTYMPIGVSVGDGQSYTNLETGITGKGFDIIAGKVGLGGQGAANFTQQDLLVGGSETLGRFGSEIDSLTSGFFNTETTRRLGLLSQGVALNPNTVVAYEGPQIRTFQFNFKLIAESAKEQIIAKDIVDLFRTYMYPEELGELALQYPALFKISFYNGEDPNLHLPKIAPCFLQTMNTNYNPTGNSYHVDGSPVEIDLELQFTETEVLTRNDLYGDEFAGKDPRKNLSAEANEELNNEIQNDGSIAAQAETEGGNG